MKIIYFYLILLSPILVYSQQGIISLSNPYFHDTPKPSTVPKGWYNCGESGESPPDIFPNGYFKVKHLGQGGRGAYVGMVARENWTTEGIGQELPQSLKIDNCYQFSMYLARSPIYEGASRTTDENINYNKPVKILIFGGHSECDENELLAESPIIEHEDWRLYYFNITSRSDIKHFFLK